MKRTPLRTLTCLSAIGLALTGSSNSVAQGPPPGPADTARPAAVPVNHAFAAAGSLTVTDLAHGTGAALRQLRRVWEGKQTFSTHFGPGWSDSNHFLLTRIAPDQLVIWRGGAAWQSAQGKGNGFRTSDGATIRMAADGWTANLLGGVWTFDSKGLLRSRKTPASREVTYTYDDRDRLTSVGTGDNRLVYHYDQAGKRVRSVEGPEGLKAEYTYDDNGRLAAVTSAWKIRVQYRYSKDGALASATDQFGVQVSLTGTKPADDPNLKANQPNWEQTIEKIAAAAGFDPVSGVKGSGGKQKVKGVKLRQPLRPPAPTFKIDSKGRVAEKQSGGQKTRYGYDESGRLAMLEAPGARTSIGYDAFGRIRSLTHPDRRTTQIEYNALDLPVLIVRPDQTREKLSYNEQGQLQRRETSPTDWDSYEYDKAGRLAVSRHPPALEKRYAYDDKGRLAQIAYSTGAKVSYSYDAKGRVAKESWSSGRWTQWTYDSAGRLSKTETSAGQARSYSYLGQLAAVSDSVHGRTSFGPGASDLEQAVRAPGQGTWRYRSDPWGRLAALTEPSGEQDVYSYNPAGQVTAVKTPSGSGWFYGYDQANRLTTIRGPGGFRTTLTRDGAGRVTEVKRGDLRWRTYGYDDRGRLREISSPLGLAAAYKYGEDGAVNEVQLPGGAVRQERADGGKRPSLKAGDYEVEESFHPDGRLAGRLYKPAQLELKLPRNANGQPAGIELNGLKVSYGYSKTGRLERIELPGGQVVQLAGDAAGRPTQLTFGKAIQIQVAYDRADRITALQAQRPDDANPFWQEGYVFDSAGNLVAIEGPAAPLQLAYDKDNRLVKAAQGDRAQTFAYDPAGNLSATGDGKRLSRWVLDREGRPIHQDSLTYTWDAAGALRTAESDQGKVENTWDAASRLTRRHVGGLEWRYGYLPNGDRLWQESSAGKTWYAYLDSGLAGFKDEQGVVWLLVSLPGTDWPLALCGSNGQTWFAVADRLHSLRRLVDDKGAVAATADYGPYGRREAASGPQKLALYAGLLRDESGLCYARQRYYDPLLGRFLSIDPLPGSPGNPASHNAYAYAANNPYRYRDPSGAGGGTDSLPSPTELGMWTAEEAERASRAEAARDQALDVLHNPQSTDEARGAAQGVLQQANQELGSLRKIGFLRKYRTDAQQLLDNNAQDIREGRRPSLTPEQVQDLESGRDQLGQQLEGLGAPVDANPPQLPPGSAPPPERTVPRLPGGNPNDTIGGPGTQRQVDDARPLGLTEGEAPRGGQPAPPQLEGQPPTPPGESGPTPVEGAPPRTDRPTGPLEPVNQPRDTGPVQPVPPEPPAQPPDGGGVGVVRRWIDRIRTGVQIVRTVGPDAALVGALGAAAGYTGYEAYQANAAERQEHEADARTRQMVEQMINGRPAAQGRPAIPGLSDPKFSNKLRPNPETGRPWDFNNPADRQTLFLRINANLQNGKAGLDGIALRTTGDLTPEERQQYQAALDAARALVARAQQLRAQLLEADAEAQRQEGAAQGLLQGALASEAVLAPLYQGLNGLPAAADAVGQGTAAVRDKIKGLQDAYTALQTAGEGAGRAADDICAKSQRSRQVGISEARDLRRDAVATLGAAARDVQAALDRIDSVDTATDALSASIPILEGFRGTMDSLRFGALSTNVTKALQDAQQAIDAARTAHERVATLRGQIQPIPGQVRGLLQPYLWSAEALAVIAQADALPPGLLETGLIDWTLPLQAARAGLQRLTADSQRAEQILQQTDIDALEKEAKAALADLDGARVAGEFSKRSAVLRPLQRAMKCLGEFRPMTASVPIVRIDHPANGQKVAPGMVLQVVGSAEDLVGVQSLSLSILPSPNSPVLSGPFPEQFTFEPGLTQTGSKIFTLNLKPKSDIDPLFKTVVMNVTAVNTDGATATATRLITVGGDGQDLVYTVNPFNPVHRQPVRVTITVVNPNPGDKVAYTLVGTDRPRPYRQAGTLDVRPDGTVTFEVPGAAESGIIDRIEARIVGTNVVQPVSYIFH